MRSPAVAASCSDVEEAASSLTKLRPELGPTGEDKTLKPDVVEIVREIAAHGAFDSKKQFTEFARNPGICVEVLHSAAAIGRGAEVVNKNENGLLYVRFFFSFGFCFDFCFGFGVRFSLPFRSVVLLHS